MNRFFSKLTPPRQGVFPAFTGCRSLIFLKKIQKSAKLHISMEVKMNEENNNQEQEVELDVNKLMQVRL